MGVATAQPAASIEQYDQLEADVDEALRQARIERYGANRYLRFALSHFQHRMVSQADPARRFVPPAWFHADLTAAIDATLRTPNGRLAYAMSRKFAKSTYGPEIGSLYAAAEGLAYNQVIVGASSDEREYLTRLRNVTNEIERNPTLLAEHPRLAFARDAKNQWISHKDREIVLGAGRIGAMPLGGNIRGQSYDGKRPDVIWLDDPETRKLVRSPERLKEAWNWIQEDLLPALAPGGRVIWGGTYLGYDCLLKRARGAPPDGKGWPGPEVPIETEDQVPNWPQLFPFEECRRMESSTDLGPRAYAIEMLLKPQADEDKLFTVEQFEQSAYSRNRLTRAGDRWLIDGQPLTVYQRVDPASGKYEDKGDYFALATVGFNPHTEDLYLLDLFRGRVPYRRQVEICRESYDHWQPRLQRIEANQVQVWLKQGVLETRAMRVEEINSTKGKFERIETWSILVANGKVHLDLSHQSQRELVHHEADHYPLGKYDDGLDAVSGACEDALEHGGGGSAEDYHVVKTSAAEDPAVRTF